MDFKQNNYFKTEILSFKDKSLKKYLILVSEYKPSSFCLQQTFLKSDFNIYNYVHIDSSSLLIDATIARICEIALPQK